MMPQALVSPLSVSAREAEEPAGRQGWARSRQRSVQEQQPYQMLSPTDYPFLAAEGEVNHILTAPSLQHRDFSANQSLKTGSMKDAISYWFGSVWCRRPRPVPCDGFLCISAVPWVGWGPSEH